MFWIMPEGNRKAEPGETDPEKLAQLLEIELMQKRATWQRSMASRQNLRVVSFFFLFLVIAGALFAFYYLRSSGDFDELRERRAAAGQTTPSPTVSARPHP